MSNNLTENLNDSLEDKVDRLISVVQSMDSRLETLGERVDKRLRETQPIWESVQAQIAEVRESQQSLLESHQSLVEDVRALRVEVAGLRADTEKGFRTFDRRMERQIGEFERLHAYQRDLEDRVDKIEKLSTP